MMLLLRLGLLCSNDIIIRRIVPYVVALLEDNVAIVRAISIRTLRNLLLVLDSVSSIDANIFELHLFSSLGKMTKDTESIVRVIFAESIGRFAEVSKKFLDISHFEMQRKDNAPDKNSDVQQQSANTIGRQYDYRLKNLHDQCSRWIRDVILDSAFNVNVERKLVSQISSSPLKRILLLDVVRLCTFFNSHESVVFFVTQLLTYLNEQVLLPSCYSCNVQQDWEVRCEFCSKVPLLCAVLGPALLPLDCILPSIEKYLYDSHEMVVTAAITCLVKLTELCLLPLNYIVESIEKTVMLVLHPSDAIRASVIKLIVAACHSLGSSEAYVHIVPHLHPFIRNAVAGFEISPGTLSETLITPVSRALYNQMMLESRSKLMNSANAHGKNGLPSVSEESSMNVSTVIVDLGQPRNSENNTAVPPRDNSGTRNNFDDTIRGNSAKTSPLQHYVEFVAKELHKKTIQYRQDNRTNTSTTFGRRQSIGMQGSVSHIESVFDYSDNNTTPLTNLVQHFVIPSQRNSLKNFAAEEVRKCDLTLADLDRVKEAYGVSINSADIARTLALGENPTDSQRHTAMKTSEAISGDPQSIVRKIKAIPLPPVSPDLGCLIQPTDGRKYRYYC